MQIDGSAADLFLSYADGDVPLSRIWGHPAYEIARKHASVLGRDLTQADVQRAMNGERTTFSEVEDVTENRDRIDRLLDHVRSQEAEWTDLIDRQLLRVTPDEDVSDVILHLAIGYELGIGLGSGAYVNLNDPFFLESPRQLLYTAIHESSHVLYEREHGSITELGSKPMRSREVQWRVFNTIVHTEAFATYTPLKLRKADGNVGGHDHALCEDYRVLADEALLSDLVVKYDSFRQTLRDGAVSRDTLFKRLFSELRLPYRVGLALLTGIEEKAGLEELRGAFYMDPEPFCETYDWVLNEYRTRS
ncbi:hypothetical protein [Natronorubrum tibetense]|uniref:Uncharacterized protein n=1 Tax=Natronorubrum tibetense GA33 TaxID=1114856 RepID=L9W0C5_9EURY|nr:hypothetical protein [Natronorubrum tibetense]ELY42944.1 hypothetical protein C496_06407 [Natronorubrum tibetense GA33]